MFFGIANIMLFQFPTSNPNHIPHKVIFVQSAWRISRVQLKSLSYSRLFPLLQKPRKSQIGGIGDRRSLIIEYIMLVLINNSFIYGTSNEY